MTYLTFCPVCKGPCDSTRMFCSAECEMLYAVTTDAPREPDEDAPLPCTGSEHEERGRRIVTVAIAVAIMFLILFAVAVLDGGRKGGQAL